MNKGIKAILFISFVTILVYVNSIGGDFVWDDTHQIVKNPYIKSLKNIPVFFTSNLWSLTEDPAYSRLNFTYRPLYILSFSLDHLFWGLNPVGYHITNVILHLLVSIMVYVISLKIIGTNLPALISGLVFSLHPIHTESVSFIAGRADSMAVLFLLVAFYLYIRFRHEQRIFLLLLSLFAYSLAIFSKEATITLPFLLLLYELSFIRDKKTIKYILPYLMPIILYLSLRVVVLENPLGGFYKTIPFTVRVYSTFGILVKYLALMVSPINQNALYVPISKTSILDKEVLLSIAILIFVSVLVVLSYKRKKKVFFAASWFFLSLMPVMNLVPLHTLLMAERYLYQPSVGFSMLIGILFTKASSHKDALSNYGTVLIIPVLILYSFLTFQRNYVWKDRLTLYTNMVTESPNSASAHYNLGLVYTDNGLLDKAIKEYQAAIKLDPTDYMFYYNLGIVYIDKGLLDEAIEEYRQALRLKPKYFNALNNLGNAYADKGLLDEAIGEYNKALKVNPNSAVVHYNLGLVYMEKGLLAETIKAYRSALKLNPHYLGALYNLALVLENTGDKEEAVANYRKFIEIAPLSSKQFIERAKEQISELEGY